MAPYIKDRGGRPSRRSEGTPADRVRANEYNPADYKWMYKGVGVELRVSSEYAPSRNNPKRGSIHECCGVIDNIDYDGSSNLEYRPVSVIWDNGGHNSYLFKDLCRTKDSPHGENKKKEKQGKLFNTSNVVLLKPGYFPPGVENPSMGSGFQCPGTVIDAAHGKSEVSVEIRWNNGMPNNYVIKYEAEKNHRMSPLVDINDENSLKALLAEHPNLAYKLTKTGQKDDWEVLSILRKAAGIEEPDHMAEFIAKQGSEYFELSTEYVSFDADDGDVIPVKWHHISASHNEDPSDR